MAIINAPNITAPPTIISLTPSDESPATLVAVLLEVGAGVAAELVGVTTGAGVVPVAEVGGSVTIAWIASVVISKTCKTLKSAKENAGEAVDMSKITSSALTLLAMNLVETGNPSVEFVRDTPYH
jgi:hypothetical protein